MALTPEENAFVDKALVDSEALGGEMKEAIHNAAFVGLESPDAAFVKMDTDYPQVLNDDGSKKPSKEIKELHTAYIDRQTLAMLTYSLFQASGNQPPRGYAMKEEVAERILRNLKYRVKRVKSLYAVELHVPGHKAILEDSSRWVVILRALHFIATRQDPDLEEYIVRRLAEQIGRTENAAIPL